MYVQTTGKENSSGLSATYSLPKPHVSYFTYTKVNFTSMQLQKSDYTVSFLTRKDILKMRQGCTLQSTERAEVWLYRLSCTLTWRVDVSFKPPHSLLLFKCFGQPFYTSKVNILNCPINVPAKDPSTTETIWTALSSRGLKVFQDW